MDRKQDSYRVLESRYPKQQLDKQLRREYDEHVHELKIKSLTEYLREN